MDKDLLIELRKETGMGVMDIKKALAETGGDKEKALAILREKGAAVMAKREDKTAEQGIIDVYAHDGRIGVLVELNCETDFVARNEEFKAFAHDLSLQISAMEPATVEELLEQDFIKDPSKKMADLLNDLTAKMGEKLVIKRFVRYVLGE